MIHDKKNDYANNEFLTINIQEGVQRYKTLDVWQNK